MAAPKQRIGCGCLLLLLELLLVDRGRTKLVVAFEVRRSAGGEVRVARVPGAHVERAPHQLDELRVRRVFVGDGELLEDERGVGGAADASATATSQANSRVELSCEKTRMAARWRAASARSAAQVRAGVGCGRCEEGCSA